MNKERKQQITLLINRLESLTLEANEVTRELQTLNSQEQGGTRQTGHSTNNTPSFEIGDRVIITNRYLGQHGIQGLVLKTTKKRVTFKNETTNRTYTRAHKNVRKLTNKEHDI